MATDRTRRLRPLLPTNREVPPADEPVEAAPAPAATPLISRLATLEARREAAVVAPAAIDEPAAAETSPVPAAPAQDPYLAFALRWWWLIILGALIGGGAAFGYTRYGPVPFQSVAQVQVPAQTTNDPTANSSQARSAATNYAAEAVSPQMFALVSKALDGKLPLSANDLILMNQAGQLDIRLVKNTNLISITVTDPDPNKARILADTFATVFVSDVNSRASTQLDARGLQLQEQIKQTQDRLVVAQLQQRAESLRQQLVTQRGLLLQLQLGYQQELQRQAESDRLLATTGQQPSPQVIETRTLWLKLIQDQVTAMQTTLNDLTKQLDDVNTTLKGLPAGTDPTVSAAFATAYSEQLQSLTKELADWQLGGTSGREPLVRYGQASDPLAANGRKKILMMGLVAGVALGIALGFLFDLLKQQRAKKKGARAGQETAGDIAPVSAEPVADLSSPNVVTQQAPDLVPLPMHTHTETSDVRWRRA